MRGFVERETERDRERARESETERGQQMPKWTALSGPLLEKEIPQLGVTWWRRAGAGMGEGERGKGRRDAPPNLMALSDR